jgi:ferredoxin
VRVRVDEERCTGHGRCHSACPEVFDLDENGFSVIRVTDVPEPLEDKARLAVHNCPESAISAK